MSDENWGQIREKDYYAMGDRIREAEAERDSLRKQLAEANAEINLMTELIKTQNAAFAKMREALEHFLIGAKHMSCCYQPEDPDPTWHCCNWSEVVEKIEAALSTDSGRATLERIKGLEAKATRLDSLRPEVLWFAEQMESQLRLHDEAKGKQGWKGMTFLELFELLDEERKELSNALRDGTAEDLIHEAADVANIAMMVADNAKTAIDAYLKAGGEGA